MNRPVPKPELYDTIVLALILSATMLSLVAGCSDESGEQPGVATEGESHVRPDGAGQIQSVDTSVTSEATDESEQVVRDFLVAMVSGDEQRVRDSILPHPDPSPLWQGNLPPADARDALITTIRKQPLRRLRPGDVVDVPGSGRILLDETRINDKRVEFAAPNSRVPFVAVRDQGVWKVDASPIIAARVAARRASLPMTEPEQWSASDESLIGLAPRVEIAGYSIQPPLDYAIQQQAIPNGQAFVWQSRKRDDRTSASLTMITTQLDPADAGLPLEGILQGVLDSIKKRRQTWQVTSPERGAVNGLVFIRVRWAGRSVPLSRPELSERQMYGIVDLTIDGTTAIQLLSQDVDPHHLESLKVAESSVRTLSRATD